MYMIFFVLYKQTAKEWTRCIYACCEVANDPRQKQTESHNLHVPFGELSQFWKLSIKLWTKKGAMGQNVGVPFFFLFLKLLGNICRNSKILLRNYINQSSKLALQSSSNPCFGASRNSKKRDMLKYYTIRQIR